MKLAIMSLTFFLLCNIQAAVNDNPSFDQMKEDHNTENVGNDNISKNLNYSQNMLETVSDKAQLANDAVGSPIENALESQKAPVETNEDTDSVSMHFAGTKKVEISAEKKFPTLPKNTSINVIYQNLKYGRKQQSPSIRLPRGLSCSAVLLEGINVSDKKKSANLQIDGLCLGPNGTKIDLSDCIIQAEFDKNYNDERLYAELEYISCRNPDGSTEDIQITGKIQSPVDDYEGLPGKLIFNGKAKELLLESGQKIFGGIGSAVSMANITTSSIVGAEGVVTQNTNVTGNKGSYVAGRALEDMSKANIMQSAIDHYKQLVPSIGVPANTSAIIVLKNPTDIPIRFFKYQKDDGENQKYKTTNVRSL